MDKMELRLGKMMMAFVLLIAMASKGKAQINIKAPLIVKDSIEINAPPEKVWRMVTEIRQWPQRYSFFKSTALEGGVAVGSKFEWRGKDLRKKGVITLVKENEEFCWRVKKFGVTVLHNWRFIKTPAGCLLVSEESLDGAFVKLFKRKFKNSFKESAYKWNLEIKAVSEESSIEK